MSLRPISASTGAGCEQHPAGAIPGPMLLRGRGLALARAGWLAISVLAASLFLAGIPFGFQRLQSICTDSAACGLAPEDGRVLRDLGLSPNSYAAYMMALELIRWLGFIGVGVIIFRRRSSDRMALLAALMLVTLGTSVSTGVETLAEADPAWRLPYLFVGFLGWTLVFSFFYLFPDGRFVPPWTRTVVLWWSVFLALFIFFPGWPFSPQRWPDWLEGLAWAAAWFTGLGAQVYRYARISGPSQRQQTKWVVYGLAVAVATGAVGVSLYTFFYPPLAEPGLPGLLGDIALAPLLTGLFLIVPLSIALAILRDRLWDIDLVINRTLVYAALTAIVAGLYALIVAGLGALL